MRRGRVLAGIILLILSACGLPNPMAVRQSSPAASPTTANVYAPTPSASAPAGFPVAPPCDPGVYPGTGFKPSTIFIGCATSADSLDHLAWTGWTSTYATANGQHNVNNCRPDCARGTFSSAPVQVKLTNPGYPGGFQRDLAGVLVFQTISLVPAGMESAGVIETRTLPSGTVGAWGWVSN